MSDSLKLLNHVLAPERQANQSYVWDDLLAAMHDVTSAGITRQVGDLLVALLRFDGRFNLTPTSDRPHRLSPEDMIKSLAIQALGKWDAADYILEIQNIETTARSPGLASVARSTIQHLRRTSEQAEFLLNIAEELAALSEPAADQLPMNPQAAGQLQVVYSAYQAKDFKTALKLLRRWGCYLPASQVAYLRGAICYNVRSYAAAAKFYQRAAEIDPGDTSYLRLYLSALERSNPIEADVFARRILANAERHPLGLVVTAGSRQFVALHRVDYRDAEADYQELIRIFETVLAGLRSGGGQESAEKATLAMAFAILGFCWDHLGNTERALHYYNAGLEAFPSNDALLVARGILLYGLDTPASVLDFQSAIKFNSPVVWPNFFLAHDFLVNRRTLECLQTCERALKFRASDAVRANLYEWLAISRSELGYPLSEVRTAFEAAIRLDSENERIRKNFAAFEESLRRDPPALWVWEKTDVSDVRDFGRAEYRPSMAA